MKLKKQNNSIKKSITSQKTSSSPFESKSANNYIVNYKNDKIFSRSKTAKNNHKQNHSILNKYNTSNQSHKRVKNYHSQEKNFKNKGIGYDLNILENKFIYNFNKQIETKSKLIENLTKKLSMLQKEVEFFKKKNKNALLPKNNALNNELIDSPQVLYLNKNSNPKIIYSKNNDSNNSSANKNYFICGANNGCNIQLEKRINNLLTENNSYSDIRKNLNKNNNSNNPFDKNYSDKIKQPNLINNFSMINNNNKNYNNNNYSSISLNIYNLKKKSNENDMNTIKHNNCNDSKNKKNDSTTKTISKEEVINNINKDNENKEIIKRNNNKLTLDKNNTYANIYEKSINLMNEFFDYYDKTTVVKK